MLVWVVSCQPLSSSDGQQTTICTEKSETGQVLCLKCALGDKSCCQMHSIISSQRMPFDEFTGQRQNIAVQWGKLILFNAVLLEG